MNVFFLQKHVSDITVELLTTAIKHAYSEGHDSYAPLGCGGDDYILYGTSRRMEISVRLHSGDVKLLVCDNIGQFLFYGGYDTSLLPISFIAEQYFAVIQNVGYLLENTIKSTSITEEDKEAMFNAYSMMKAIIK